VKADNLSPKVLQLVESGYSYRKIAEKLNLSKTTVNDIVKRHRQSGKKLEETPCESEEFTQQVFQP
jgi:putative DNA-invertase from lambdoid prophage Rac